jgi:hypothetical protein
MFRFHDVFIAGVLDEFKSRTNSDARLFVSGLVPLQYTPPKQSSQRNQY